MNYGVDDLEKRNSLCRAAAAASAERAKGHRLVENTKRRKPDENSRPKSNIHYDVVYIMPHVSLILSNDAIQKVFFFTAVKYTHAHKKIIHFFLVTYRSRFFFSQKDSFFM